MKRSNMIQGSAALAGVLLMMCAAAWLHCREIIFPEIAAVAVGSLVAPRRAWQVSKLRMIVWIGVCAVLGVVIVRFVPAPKFAQMWLAYLLCQLLLAVSRTGFAPMISAAVLPVMLGTTTIIYPVSAVLLTGCIAALTALLEKTGCRLREDYVPQPLPDRQEITDIALRVLLVGIVLFAALKCSVRFAVAPPLLVAFTEFSRRSCPARKCPVRAVGLIAAAATLGAVSRGVLSELWGLPFAAAAVVCMALVITVMYALQLYLPPAGALALLPFLIPQKELLWYPVMVAAGAAIFMLLACLMFRETTWGDLTDTPIDRAIKEQMHGKNK